MLQASEGPLIEAHDLVMFDLDGVLYVGGQAVPYAAEAVSDARRAGAGVALVTNNASRPPGAVVDRLAGAGVAAEVEEVVTSAQAAARLVRERLDPGARVGVLGGAGVEQALSAEGLEPVADLTADGLQGIVSGYGPDVLWRDVMRAAVLIRDGLWWVATNSDLTIPTPWGVAPGHGVQVRMLSEFAAVEPVVAGKPSPPLLEETMRRHDATAPLMVGDRLDTDIEGARRVDVPSLLVLTGVTDLRELAGARPEERPTYLSRDLRGLRTPHPPVHSDQSSARCGGWTAHVESGTLTLTGDGAPDDWWRAAAVAAWAHLDEHGSPADVRGAVPPGDGGGR